MIAIAINGAAGRMGRRLVALGHEADDLQIAAALESAGHPELGRDAGLIAGAGEVGVPLSAGLGADVDVLIDFSTPAGAAAAVALSQERNIPLVMATTGLSDAQRERVAALARLVPVVWAPNMSTAVNLTMKLVEQAAAALRDVPGGADVEILERHHRFKEDAPSGTALRFGELIAAAMGQTRQVHGRVGQTGQRSRQEIGFHALRVGDNPGEHTIVFGLLGETIELTVRATNRDCYALGALSAARFLGRQREPGLFTMYDVLGLS